MCLEINLHILLLKGTNVWPNLYAGLYLISPIGQVKYKAWTTCGTSWKRSVEQVRNLSLYDIPYSIQISKKFKEICLLLLRFLKIISFWIDVRICQYTCIEKLTIIILIWNDILMHNFIFVIQDKINVKNLRIIL